YISFVGRLGDVAMAAHQSLIAIESLGFIAANGFGVAAGALVAQKLGAGSPPDAAACGWLSAGLAVLVLGGVSILFLVFPRALIGLFTTEAAVLVLGTQCLRVAAVAQPFMALADAMAGALRGAGDTRSPMVATVYGPLCVRLILCWTLAFTLDWGLLGIWIGTTVDWAVRAIFLLAVFRRGRWKSIQV
ncbi:MAG: MATE family efflux transporter, partial [Myxococcota bacterium]|nr:MATE family efflux transporter [Myxococcota bacterium]